MFINTSILAQEQGLNVDTINIIEQKKIKPDSQIDSSYKQFFNLGESLADNTHLFIRSYGAGSSSTITSRGGSPSQIKVLWNQIPIENPMLGLNDLSLIPSNLFDKIEFYDGGQSTNMISGAMTGVLSLENSFNRQSEKVNLNLKKGSFGSAAAHLNYFLNTNKFKSQFQILHNKSNNDFSFITNNQSKKQKHAYFKTSAYLGSTEYWINNKNKLDFHIWWQKTFREIPPTLVQTRSKSEQDDLTKRINLGYTGQFKNHLITSNIAYIDEENNFRDSINLIYSDNTFKKWVNNTQLKLDIDKLGQIKASVIYQHSTGNSAFYEFPQSTSSIDATIQYLNSINPKSTIKLALNKNWHNISFLGLAPSIEFDQEVFKIFKYNIKISKEQRAPTINELFWRPGGDNNLLPETAWNKELNVFLTKKTYSSKLSIFHRETKNWILWALQPSNNFYSASNIAEVSSYGFIIDTKSYIFTSKVRHNLSVNYAFTKSINKKAISNPIIAEGSQLFYTPIHKANFLHKAKYLNWSASNTFNWTSNTVGILDNIEDYFLWHMNISKDLKIKNFQTNIQFEIRNILNTRYQVIERRPMPGRHFNFYLNFKF